MFASRCPLVVEQCRTERAAVFEVGGPRTARCCYREQAPELPRARPFRRRRRWPPTGPAARSSRCGSCPRPSPAACRRCPTSAWTCTAGETLGIVGETGSGKTTLARVLLGLIPPDPGSVVTLEGEPLAPSARRRPLAQLRALQIVFQNPDSALNRRHSVRRLISRPLARLAGLSGAALRARLAELVAQVRLEERHLPLRPSQLSGGLKQRVAIARAFGAAARRWSCATSRPPPWTCRCRPPS